jgi:hypothetical protein
MVSAVRALAVGLALVALLLGACSPVFGPDQRLPEPPSDADARAYLARVVALAHAGDFDALCAVGGGNCERILEQAGPDVPTDDPTLVGQRVEQPTAAGDLSSVGGRILELCGRRDDGTLYYSEMIVFVDGRSLIAIEPIFWSGLHIASSSSAGVDAMDPEVECRSRGFDVGA